MSKLNWQKRNKFRNGSTQIGDEFKSAGERWLEKKDIQKPKPKKDWDKIKKILAKKKRFESVARGDKINWDKLDKF